MMKTAFFNGLALVLFLVGALTILLEEPLYGLGLLGMAALLFRPLAPFWDRLLPQKTWIKPTLILLLGLSIAISLATFGRAPYPMKPPTGLEAYQRLSVHPLRLAELSTGMTYAYLEKGKGPTVVLLHGFPDLASTWDETITELSKDHRVIAPFLRGYYPSSVSLTDDYFVKSVAEDIIALLDHLGVERFSVVGQDWGASVGYTVTNLLEHRVDKMVGVAIPHPSCLELNFSLLLAARHFPLLSSGNYGVRYARKQDFEYIKRLYQRWSPDYKNYQQSSGPIIETFQYPGRLHAALGYYRCFAIEPPENQALYTKIPRVPIYFMAGENDAIAQPDIIARMNRTMPPGSKTKVFKQAGHFLHREVFPAFIAELRAFLEDAD